MRKSSNILFIISLLVVALNASAQQPEGNSVKGQINLNVFVQVPTTNIKYGDYYGLSYNIDASYGISKHFDLGIYYSYNHISEKKYQEDLGVNDYSNTHNFGIESRYFLTSYFIKKPVKYDFYLKGFIGKSMSKIYSGMNDEFIYHNKGDVGLLLGAKYNPIKRFGIMAEFGYGWQSGWIINMGLSFRIKK